MTSSTATGAEERVARAICRASYENDVDAGPALDRFVEQDWCDWISPARAAIAALSPDAAEQTGGAE